ncbi:MAG: S8 family serine peptidase [Polyangiaceae bacterium]
MNVRPPLFATLLGISVFSGGQLFAQTASKGEPSSALEWGTRRDPAFDTLFHFRRLTGKTFPRYRRSEAFEARGTLPVVVRFHAQPSNGEREELRARALSAKGSLTWNNDGRSLASGAFIADADERAIQALLAHRNVARVMNDLPVVAPTPSDVENGALETRIDEARRALRARDGSLLDGKGVVIADMDAGMDIFHPNFFRADAGAFVWVDVDGDGALTVDKDGVDLDGNGTIEPGEVLHRITAQAIGLFSQEPIQTPNKTFTPDIDFLYLDANGNGKRDFGAGFTEDTPAYGEPIFALDDANRDGLAQKSEKLLRLGTSKVRGVLSDKAFLRADPGAQGLINYRLPAALMAYASHGTSVAGILLGGPTLGSRWLGLAPGAELLGVDYIARGKQPTGMTAMMEWALTQKANVIITEYAPYTGYPLDGSSEEELELDAGLAKGMIPVSPAGNLATASKHVSINASDTTTVVELKTDADFVGASYATLTILHRQTARSLSLRVNVPGGASVDVPTATAQTPFGDGLTLYTEQSTTPRGTRMTNIDVVRKGGGPPSGAYSLEITTDAGAPFPVDLYAGDDRTTWGNGFTFKQNTKSRTLCHPATADKTITVSAYTLNDDPLFSPSSKVGQIAYYSSEGPRIDGARTIDLAAPDNPMSSTVQESGKPADNVILYSPFGGTSGAGPHVAASAALLRQLYPSLDGAAIRQKLLDSARKDGIGPVDAWGKGRLDVAAATDLLLADGVEPKVTLSPAGAPEAKKAFQLTLGIEDNSGPYKARWDLDYDGTPDTEWLTIMPGGLGPDIVSQAEGPRYVRVEVIDAEGNLGATTALVDVKKASPPAAAPVDAKKEDASGCSCKTHASRSSTYPLVGFLFLASIGVARRMRRSRNAHS